MDANKKINKPTSSKRINILNQNINQPQIKNVMMKQNEQADISSLSKYYMQREKEEWHPDRTDKFLMETKNQLFFSSQKLSQFKQKKRQFQYINETLNFNIVNKQLKPKKRKILSQNFNKFAKLNQTEPSQPTKKNQQKPLTDELEIDKKLYLLQKVLNQQELYTFKSELIKKAQNLKYEYSQNKLMKNKVIKYFINHQIVSKFLQQTAKDTRKLKLRSQNLRLYHRLKNQMVSLLSNQELFYRHINSVRNQEQERVSSLLQRTPMSQERLLKIQTKSKNSNNMEKPMLQRIQELLQISKNSIKQAFTNFGQPSKSNEIQVQFNKRLNNNFVSQ